MFLNLVKCEFRVSFRKFLSFMIHQWGIYINPKKVHAIIDMKPPTSIKEVQQLTDWVTALSYFLSKIKDRCKKISTGLRVLVGFRPTKSCLVSLPQLSGLLLREELYLYLSIILMVISLVLIQEDNLAQWLVYYTNHVLQDAKIIYLNFDKLTYCQKINR